MTARVVLRLPAKGVPIDSCAVRGMRHRHDRHRDARSLPGRRRVPRV